VEAVNERRVAKFLDRIDTALESADLVVFRGLVERYEREHDVPMVDIAAALAVLVQGRTPLLLQDEPRTARWTPGGPEKPGRAGKREDRRDVPPRSRSATGTPPARDMAGPAAVTPGADRAPGASPRARPPAAPFRADDGGERREAVVPPAGRHPQPGESQHEAQRAPVGSPPREDRMAPPATRPPRHDSTNAGEAMFADERPAARAPREDRGARAPEVGMETFRIEVGHAHGVQPGNIVGAIANEADLESRYIGRIDIRDDHSLVDLPEGMPREILDHLKRVRVAGQPLRMRRAAEAGDAGGPRRGPGKPKGAPSHKPGFRPRPPRNR
jgi:ATP-dependent RNA helicase DeaD